MPTARSMPRAGARSYPSVTSRERGFMSISGFLDVMGQILLILCPTNFHVTERVWHNSPRQASCHMSFLILPGSESLIKSFFVAQTQFGSSSSMVEHRLEERRVGKECRYRWSTKCDKKNRRDT